MIMEINLNKKNHIPFQALNDLCSNKTVRYLKFSNKRDTFLTIFDYFTSTPSLKVVQEKNNTRLTLSIKIP